MKNTLALATCMLMATPVAAQATRFDGNALLARCSSPEAKLCEVYLDGFASALPEMPVEARHACLPETVNGAQMKDVLLKYLRNEPEHRDWLAGKFILHAFAKAWPCRQ